MADIYQNGSLPHSPSLPSSLSPPLLMYLLLWKLGPVEACFEVYQDFMSYTSGVYVRKSDSDLGGHCIKIIGWGVTATGVKVSIYPIKYILSCVIPT